MKNLTWRMLPRFALLTLLACGLSSSAWAGVTASIDKTDVALGETLRLLVQSDDASGQLDIGPLRRDFDILGSSSGSSIEIVNGHTSSMKQVSLFLSPRHPGTIIIPALLWSGQQSAPLQLTVRPAGGGNNGGNNGGNSGGHTNGNGGGNNGNGGAEPSAVFLTSTPDPAQPYVQGAVVLTVRLYVATRIEQASLNMAGNADVSVKQIGSDSRTQENRDGHDYQVIVRKYLLIPQHSGHVSLPGPVLEAQVADANAPDPFNGFFGNAFGNMPGAMRSMRPLRLAGANIDLNVLPRPAAAANGQWVPAQDLTLEETWSPDGGAIHAGEPLTRHLHLAAAGLSGAQLPDLGAMMVMPEGVESYPDQAKTAETLQGGKLAATRDQDIAVIAGKAGRYNLPAIHLVWWDTAKNEARTADLPARSVDILPADGATATAAPVAATAGNPLPAAASPDGAIAPATAMSALAPWQWVSAALVLLWLITVLAWWWTRRRAPSPKSAVKAATTASIEPAAGTRAEPVLDAADQAPVLVAPATGQSTGGKGAAAALAALRAACRENDAPAARRHVLDWAASFWPEAPPRGLNAVALRLGEPRFTAVLQQLDRACYVGGDWQGDALAQLFSAPPSRPSAARGHKQLPDLYS